MNYPNIGYNSSILSAPGLTPSQLVFDDIHIRNSEEIFTPKQLFTEHLQNH